MREGICLFVFLLFVFAFDLSLVGVINVPADQPTIQDGIDAATTGDTVLIADGTYTGTGNRDLDFGGKAIVVTSVNGAGATTIDCEESGRGFIFNNGEGPGSILKGLTILHAYADTGAGLLISAASPVIRECVFRQLDTVASSYYGYHLGGGGACLNGSQSRFEDCIFRFNYAMAGSGLFMEGSCDIPLTGCSFEQNYSHCYGYPRSGALQVRGSSAQITNCRFDQNILEWIQWDEEGSASIDATDSDILVAFCTFTGNQTRYETYDLGGASGVHARNGTAIVENCTFFQQHDWCCYGQGVPSATCVYFEGAEITLRLNVFAYNGQSEYGNEGPPINWDVALAPPIIECNVFFHNGENEWAGPIASIMNTNGNAYVAPRFCDTASASVDLHPASGSYCAPDINSCGVLIGALPIDSGCDLGCCTGYRGNVDCDPLDMVDITDLAVMINELFVIVTPFLCEEEADLDLSGAADITDLSILIDNQFLTLSPLPPCR